MAARLDRGSRGKRACSNKTCDDQGRCWAARAGGGQHTRRRRRRHCRGQGGVRSSMRAVPYYRRSRIQPLRAQSVWRHWAQGRLGFELSIFARVQVDGILGLERRCAWRMDLVARHNGSGHHDGRFPGRCRPRPQRHHRLSREPKIGNDRATMNNRFALAIAVVVASLVAAATPHQAQPVKDEDHAATAGNIRGVVTSRFGPEAGVWVIAETKDLGTRFAKIVVTDHSGRFVVPDLPKARYDVWVRGYGLADSPKIASEPGKSLNLAAVIAPELAAAAQYYPAVYWFSLLRAPDKSKFPGTGPNGNGIPVEFKSQDQWLDVIKTNGCGNCHQLGNYATRNIPPALGHFDSSIAAWAQRLQAGPGGTTMVRTMGRLLTPDGGHLAALADWTDRIKAGELPGATPPRPVGIERNLVITARDWLDPKHYLHDVVTTDRRRPTVNGHGLIYGATELSTDQIPALDAINNSKTTIKVPVRDPEATPSSAQANPVFAPSPYFGSEQVWDSQVNAHSLVMDQEGRVYFAAQTRPPNNIPAYCRKDSPLRSAQLYPLEEKHEGFFQNARQVTVYDPTTKKFSFIDTCFGTQHLNFAEDADNTLWFSPTRKASSPWS